MEIDIQVDAYIPDSYIADGHLKIEMYKKFRGVTALEEVDELKEEMVDRFGDYPIEVEYLFDIAFLKIHAMAAQVDSIKQHKQEVTVLISENASSEIDGSKVFQLTSQIERRVGLGMEGKRLKITLPIKDADTKQWMEKLVSLAKGLVCVKKDKVNQ